jgi:transaldolase
MSAVHPSPLQQTAAIGGNDYWNDSCSVEELRYALANGAVGATTNPTIVLGVLKKELAVWRGPLQRIIDRNPTWTEIEVAWRLIEEMAL